MDLSVHDVWHELESRRVPRALYVAIRVRLHDCHSHRVPPRADQLRAWMRAIEPYGPRQLLDFEEDEIQDQETLNG